MKRAEDGSGDAHLEQFLQVVELTVNITTDLYGGQSNRIT